MMLLTNYNTKKAILVQSSSVDCFEPCEDSALIGSWVNFQSGRQVMVAETISEIAAKDLTNTVSPDTISNLKESEAIEQELKANKKSNLFKRLFKF